MLKDSKVFKIPFLQCFELSFNVTREIRAFFQGHPSQRSVHSGILSRASYTMLSALWNPFKGILHNALCTLDSFQGHSTQRTVPSVHLSRASYRTNCALWTSFKGIIHTRLCILLLNTRPRSPVRCVQVLRTPLPFVWIFRPWIILAGDCWF